MTTTTTRRLSARGRKVYLVVHLLAAAAWFGTDLALGVLVATAGLTSSPQTAGAALQAAAIVAVWPMLTASLVCLASGVVLGLGTKYGLLRYWWVVVKFAINLLYAVLIVVALRPTVERAADAGARLVAGDGAALAATLLPPVVVGPTLLLTAYLLSVFKPWGRTRQPRRAAGRLQAAPSRSAS
ncbi:hypothetical protein [Saccharopolyspora hordei]|uniref:Putative membrane protein n=1 Tax=Saccharopolyspora hordei TaxID=1838 RepID=A0A853AK68_9PSEU|nr:hypothetical protein [Saccharopolyspora hordei]NYI85082.1 putative membrane protein [Saccharopolyspora hordei]